MKLLTAQELDFLKESFFRQGVEHCLTEMLSKQLVCFDKHTETGAAMKLVIDKDDPNKLHAAVREFMAHSPFATQTLKLHTRGYVSLSK